MRLGDCSSLCNTKKKRRKKKGIFIHVLKLGWLPSWSGHKSENAFGVKGPLFIPNKVTVHSATVNSKNVASAKVNIFYSEIPVPGKVHGALVQRDALHTCSPRRGSLTPCRGSSLVLRLSGCLRSSWSPCSSGCAWGAGGCSRCPSSAASASRSGSSTWSRPGVRSRKSKTMTNISTAVKTDRIQRQVSLS